MVQNKTASSFRLKAIIQHAEKSLPAPLTSARQVRLMSLAVGFPNVVVSVAVGFPSVSGSAVTACLR